MATIAMKRVKVDRAFYFKGEAQRIGASINLPVTFAQEMVAAHKASFLPDVPDEKVEVKTGDRNVK